MRTPTRGLVKLAMLLGYINSLMMLCHQSMDGEAQATKDQTLDGIHQTKLQMSQHGDHMVLILLVLVISTQTVWLNINIITITNIEILEMRESLKRFTVSHQTINLFFHSHGEESRKPIHKTASRTHHGNGSIRMPRRNLLPNITTITIINIKILEMKVSLKRFTDLHQTINQSSHNHGEESRKLTHKTDSRTHHGNGLTKTPRRSLSLNTIIITSIEILVMKELSRKFMASHQPTSQFCHNPGEELRSLIQLMALRTHLGNGSTSQKLRRLNHLSNTITIIIINIRILVMKVSLKRSMDSLQMINQFSHNHGEESRKLTHKMASRTHLGNGLTKMPRKNPLPKRKREILETMAL
jgi:hypothetical protein